MLSFRDKDVNYKRGGLALCQLVFGTRYEFLLHTFDESPKFLSDIVI